MFSHLPYLVAGILIGALITNISYLGLSRRKSTVQNAFVLGVTVKFVAKEDKEEFLVAFKPLAEHISKFEKTTVSYELMDSDKDHLQLYILERYVDKQAYLEIHKKTPEFLSFREKVATLQREKGVTLDGNSYIESGIGFV